MEAEPAPPDASRVSGSPLASVSAVCEGARQASGADGVSFALASGAHDLSPVWASDAVAVRLEERQLTLGEGPCLDALATGAPVLVEDLGDPGGRVPAWPVFQPEVTGLGVGGVFAFPVQVGVISLGCLELYRRKPGPLSDVQLGATLRAADVLAGIYLSLGTACGAEDMVPPYRQVVHQAAGMMTVHLDVTIEEAMMRLRARAYSEERPIDAVAGDVVAGTVQFEEER
jgi:hypothetical protein